MDMDSDVRSFIFLTNTSAISCSNLIASVSLHPYFKAYEDKKHTYNF